MRKRYAAVVGITDEGDPGSTGTGTAADDRGSDTGDDTGGAGEGGFVIEELSRRTGLTVRSLRSYQTQKLLPPPTVRGRTGYYGEPHVTRTVVQGRDALPGVEAEVAPVRRARRRS